MHEIARIIEQYHLGLFSKYDAEQALVEEFEPQELAHFIINAFINGWITLDDLDLQ